MLPFPPPENSKDEKFFDSKKVIPTSIPFIGMTTQPKSLVIGFEPKTLVVSFSSNSAHLLIA